MNKEARAKLRAQKMTGLSTRCSKSLKRRRWSSNTTSAKTLFSSDASEKNEMGRTRSFMWETLNKPSTKGDIEPYNSAILIRSFSKTRSFDYPVETSFVLLLLACITGLHFSHLIGPSVLSFICLFQSSPIYSTLPHSWPFYIKPITRNGFPK